MNTKNNIRFREMEIRMEAAMLELMKHTEFEKITVKKICEKANVNRSTFYAHFIDIYDMLEKMESHLHVELLNSLPKGSMPEQMMFLEELTIPFLQFIKRHQYFYQIALKTRTEFPLKQGFDGMWNNVIKPKCQQAGIFLESEMMYYFVYFQSGFTNILKRWLEQGCMESEEEISRLLHNCIPNIWGKSL